MTDNPSCILCNGNVNLLHVLRDCTVAQEVWSNLSGGQLPRDFMVYDIHVWLKTNLKYGTTGSNSQWGTIFAVALDVLWRSRNERVFQQLPISSTTILAKISCSAQDIQMYQNNSSYIIKHHVSGIPSICWCPPPPGVYKLNCDGAVTYQGRTAAGSGILRDHHGVVSSLLSRPNWDVALL